MEEKLQTYIRIYLALVFALIASFAFPGIDSFRYEYRRCYANCIVDRFNDLKELFPSEELSSEEAKMYWEEEIDSCDRKCTKVSFLATILALFDALMLFPFAYLFSSLIILFFQSIYRLRH
jgi:hypothetical protein